MPRILQINADANCGSTGRIAEQINTVARNEGWETFIIYGRDSQPGNSNHIRIGGNLQVLEHYLEHRIFDNEGLSSRNATKKMVKEIERINPDLIHLHNIHDHWLNYRILFEYLDLLNIPIVWTFHDCWAFTGGCYHFTEMNCDQWKAGGCKNGCPIRKKARMRRLFEKTEEHFHLKRDLFSRIRHLTIVPVSHWMESVVRDSFFKDKTIVTIHNGIDLNLFKSTANPLVRERYGIGDSHFVLGVSSVWLPYKGWYDFIKLSYLLPQNTKLVLVGLDQKKIIEAEKHGIIGVGRTESRIELAALYSEALCFCNLTYMDTFPTTNLESLACGTPVITYRTGGSPEAITPETGFVVDQGDLDGVIRAITEVEKSGKEHYRVSCRSRAEQCFNKEDRYRDYLNLYINMMKQQYK